LFVADRFALIMDKCARRLQALRSLGNIPVPDDTARKVCRQRCSRPDDVVAIWHRVLELIGRHEELPALALVGAIGVDAGDGLLP